MLPQSPKRAPDWLTNSWRLAPGTRGSRPKAPKSCSGAFRYAARVGNSDIVAISPVQLFAEDRKLAKTRYTGRAMSGFGTERSPVLSANTMCG